MSLLDNDLYKFTMQRAVLEHYPKAWVRYKFKDRAPRGKFNDRFLTAFYREISNLASQRMTSSEVAQIGSIEALDHPAYLSYLKSFQLNTDHIHAFIEDGRLNLTIEGPWVETILWEVPLLSLISQLYFTYCEPHEYDPRDSKRVLNEKYTRLEAAGCQFAEFGTRRRFSALTQSDAVYAAKFFPNFLGTSNVYYAFKHKVPVIGTMAHEWIMGISGKEGIQRANHLALKKWSETFNGQLGIALPDTFGTNDFLKSFDSYWGRLYDGVRQDSGNPYGVGEKFINHWKSLGINPETKRIVFSDSLNTDKAIDLQNHFQNRIQVSYGIGTHLTNDVGVEPLKIVIKLDQIDDVQVVKISDDPDKAQGEEAAIKMARWYLDI